MLTTSIESWSAALTLAAALSMDSFTAAFLMLPERRAAGRTRVAWSRTAGNAALFAVVQAGMFWIGHRLGGSQIFSRESIAAYDHWLAFGLLAAVALKVAREAHSAPDEPAATNAPSRPYALALGLAVGTSLDAVGVGTGLGLTGHGSFALQLSCIIVITAAAVAAGQRLTDKLPESIQPHLQRLSALLIFGLGLKVLFDHGVFTAA